MIELIDSHCHLDFPVFDADRSALIAQCKAQGIKHFIVPGVDVENWPRLLKLREGFSEISIAFGLHPYFIDSHQESGLQLLEQYCQQHNPIAVGEIGLDFYRKDLAPEKQKHFFARQLEIAEQFNLPVILHVRKAHQDVLSLLKTKHSHGGIAHAFNGSYEQAKQYIALGFKLGFGGALTYPNATRLRKLAEQVPLDSIVLETDAPDMKPYDYAENRNTSLTLLQVLQELSEIRQCESDSLGKIFTQNVKTVFPKIELNPF